MRDLISRQAAMKRLMAQNVIIDGSEYHNGFNAGVNRAQEVIRNLPTVQPKQPKQGKWIDTETSYADGVQQKCRCSVCTRLSPRPLGDFCRWCGTDMRGE